ncbi:hypothetical protein VP1G_01578 [Cytospora mali]|uniref:Uncharacterized protein n=1 Tax=Cytospora mali TaxID=578113 RepID=A0A194URE1_CYTMA|nr:hypothetical protein VP1G_01578 [Valsa mali var. pyri (nom. inval.)]
MSLNQPSPPKEPSLLDRAKQTVASATTKVTAAREIIEEKAHDVLPPKIANLTLGERKARQDNGPRPTYPRYKPPSPEAFGIVEPDIRSASPSDGGSNSSWEAIPHNLSPRTKRRRRAQRKRPRALTNDNKKTSSLIDDFDSEFKSTCPPQLIENMTKREEWKDSLRNVREQRGNSRAVEARQEALRQARHATMEDAASSSSGESYESKSSDEFVRELLKLPNTRSWIHGVGKKRVAVPGDPPEAVYRTHHGTGQSEAEGPKEFLEGLGTSQFTPAGVSEASSVGGRLARYRDMGKYFKSGSVGDESRESNVHDDAKERAEWLKSLNLR